MLRTRSSEEEREKDSSLSREDNTSVIQITRKEQKHAIREWDIQGNEAMKIIIPIATRY